MKYISSLSLIKFLYEKLQLFEQYDYKMETHALFPCYSHRCFLLLLFTKLGCTCQILPLQIIRVQCENLSFLLIWLWKGQVGSKETKNSNSASTVFCFTAAFPSNIMGGWSGSHPILLQGKNVRLIRCVPNTTGGGDITDFLVPSKMSEAVIWLYQSPTNNRVSFPPTLQHIVFTSQANSHFTETLEFIKSNFFLLQIWKVGPRKANLPLQSVTVKL